MFGGCHRRLPITPQYRDERGDAWIGNDGGHRLQVGVQWLTDVYLGGHSELIAIVPAKFSVMVT